MATSIELLEPTYINKKGIKARFSARVSWEGGKKYVIFTNIFAVERKTGIKLKFPGEMDIPQVVPVVAGEKPRKKSLPAYPNKDLREVITIEVLNFLRKIERADS